MTDKKNFEISNVENSIIVGGNFTGNITHNINQQKANAHDSFSKDFEGIPTKIISRLQNMLQKTPYFKQNNYLQDIFLDQRISQWQYDLPAGDTLNQRILSTMAYLYQQTNSQGENALVLFLHVLSDIEQTKSWLSEELRLSIQDLQTHIKRSQK